MDESIEELFSQYKKLIIAIITKHIKYIESIILYGSYGRGEGAWVLHEDGLLKPYNDFDLLVINKANAEDGALGLIAARKELEKEIDINFIDISLKPHIFLEKSRGSIYSYDLKYGSDVIYGDSSILNSLPNISSEEIPLLEAELLFHTRLWTFIGGDVFYKNSTKEKQALFFFYQMSKAVLSVMDSLLLLIGCYDVSYNTRLINLKKYSSKIKFFRDEDMPYFEWALKNKLKPGVHGLGEQENQHDFSMKILEIYCYYMLKVLEIYHGKSFKTILSYLTHYKCKLKNHLKRLYYYIILKDSGFENQYQSSILYMYCLAKFMGERFDKKNQKKWDLILEKYNIEEASQEDMAQLRFEILKIRL
jgi:predicted nucleotidyltransferase